MINNDRMIIKDLYLQYLEQHKDKEYIYNCAYHDIQHHLVGHWEEYINQLDITLPIDKIKKIFEEYGVIQLREAETSTKLLLGCGNCPVDPQFHNDKHKHEGFVTINPALSMNPTIIGAFGIDEGLSRLLRENYYDSLHAEAVTLASSSAKIHVTALKCLKTNFKTYEIGEETPLPFDKSYLFLE